MRISHLAVAAAVLFPLLSPPAEAKTRYTGMMVITAIGGTCSYNPAGDELPTNFRPAGVSDNGTDSGLGLTYDDYQDVYVLAGGSFGSTFKTVTVTHAGNLASSEPAFVRFASQVPASLAASPDTVLVTGSIKGYDSEPACVVAFRMAGTRRN